MRRMGQTTEYSVNLCCIPFQFMEGSARVGSAKQEGAVATAR